MLLKVATKAFNFDKLSDETARRDARSHRQLAAALRANADSRFKPPGLGPEAPLTDAVVHGLDIRWPSSLDHDIPETPARVVLEFVERVRQYRPRERGRPHVVIDRSRCCAGRTRRRRGRRVLTAMREALRVDRPDRGGTYRLKNAVEYCSLAMPCRTTA